MRYIKAAALCCLAIAATTVQADMRINEKGMFTRFQPQGPARQSGNNYLLMELSNFVYGPKLLGDDHRDRNNNARFKQHFIREKKDIFYISPPRLASNPEAPKLPRCVYRMQEANLQQNQINTLYDGLKELTPNKLPFKESAKANVKAPPNTNNFPLALIDKDVLKLLQKMNKNPHECAKELEQYQEARKRYERTIKMIDQRNARLQDQYDKLEFKFEFFFANGTDGRGDPEALVAYNDRMVIVVFRGTDRVENAMTPIGFELAEWMGTSFNLTDILNTTPSGAQGHVHTGFYNSLNPIKNQMLSFLNQHRNKPIWLTGHSLGGAHAQVLATELKLRLNIRVQGVVVFGSPQLGDSRFSRWFEREVTPGNRFQRYDFSDDPVAQMFPIPGADKAGQRNWFKTERGSSNFFPNYRDSEGIHVADRGGIGLPDLCMHHQEWYRRAMYYELPTPVQNSVPRPPRAPNARASACRQSEIDRAARVTN